MDRSGNNIASLLLAVSVVVVLGPSGCSQTHGPRVEIRNDREGDMDWRRSMQMARAMLLFDRPRSAAGYARAAILLAPDGFVRQEAIALRSHAFERIRLAEGDHDSLAPYRIDRDQRYTVVARPFQRTPVEPNDTTGHILANCLLERLRRDRYTPLSRQALPAIMDERDLSAAGDDAGPSGRLQPADLLLTGTVDQTPDGWRISARLVDIHTGRLFQSTSMDANSLRDVDALAESLVRPMQLPADARPDAPGPRWIRSLLDQADTVEQKGHVLLALERHLDCLAIAPQNGSVRQAFRRFQERHGRQLSFELVGIVDEPHHVPPRIRLLLGEGVSMTLVQLPPVRDERTTPIWMQSTEVTQRQYRCLVGSSPSRHVGRDLPVERVSWYDANAFCRTLSRKTGLAVQLPSESLWERARLAGPSRPARNGLRRAERPGRPLHPGPQGVADGLPNALGLHGLGGNVAEWCRPDGGKPILSGGLHRVPVRGGSWACPPDERKAEARRMAGPTGRTSDVGFRVIVQGPENQQPETETPDEGS